jgi:hypothetical protein
MAKLPRNHHRDCIHHASRHDSSYDRFHDCDVCVYSSTRRGSSQNKKQEQHNTGKIMDGPEAGRSAS